MRWTGFLPCNKPFSRFRFILVPLLALSFVLVLTQRFAARTHHAAISDPRPLVKEHVDYGIGFGGRWFIPETWFERAAERNVTLLSSRRPQDVLEAAQLALELAFINSQYIKDSSIPLIAHQTWKNLNSPTWPEVVQDSVESWLDAATGDSDDASKPPMAYILWDDHGMESLMKRFELQPLNVFNLLPYNVEKADAFRVVVLRWFGGIYADVDVKLVQHPNRWIKSIDLLPWEDATKHIEYKHEVTSHKHYHIPPTSPTAYQRVIASLMPNDSVNIGAIFGIEADTAPDSDDYWRMGYAYPVQLTNWACAMAPHHPVALTYLVQVAEFAHAQKDSLTQIDPLDLTGPPALTRAVMAHVDDTKPGFRWEALSAIQDKEDGGRGKVVANDVLVLPITAFSPGRGWFHNMGSKPVTHPNALIFHAAQGSWRSIDVGVHIGKLCRTFLGRCKDWKKIP